MKAKDLMTREPATLAPTATVAEAATLMKQEDCGSIPIVEGGRLVGIVTDRDIVIRVVAAGKDPRSTRVADAMTADPVTIGPDTSVDDASDLMAKRQVRRLPVCEDGKLVGILVIGQVARKDDEDAGEALREISEPASGRGSHARG